MSIKRKGGCCGEEAANKRRVPAAKGQGPLMVQADGTAEIRVDGQTVKAKVGERPYGFASFIKAKTGGKVKPRIANTRLNVCRICRERELNEKGEPAGERLFRQEADRQWCGKPHGTIERRDEARHGCGCDLDDKVRWKEAACPRGRWGPGEVFGPGIVALFVDGDNPERLPGVLDFYAPTATRIVDMLGIGDTVCHARVARALHAHVQSNSGGAMRVRFCTARGRVAWAEFCLRGTDIEVADLEDPDRVNGELAYHSAVQILAEMDATIKENGWATRYEYWARRFRLDVDDVLSLGPLGSVSQRWTEQFEHFVRGPRSDGRPLVALAPYANSPTRSWPLPRWMELAHRLRAAGCAVFCHNREYTADVPSRRPQDLGIPLWAGDGSPDSLAAGVVGADVLVGNDSGLCHVAGHFGKKALAICGPTSGSIVFGGYKSVEWLQAPGGCTGCTWIVDDGWQPWCAYGCGLLADVTPEMVEQRVLKALGQRGGDDA